MDRRLFLAASAAFAGLSAQRNAAAQQQVAWRHPELDRALALLRARQWQELCALVEGLPPQRAYRLLSDLGDEAPPQIDLGDTGSHPGGDTIAAAIQIGWAWRYRGHGFASSVTQDGWTGFSNNLNLAKTRVESAVTRDTNDGVARALGFGVYTGLSDLRDLTGNLQPFLLSTRRPVGGLSSYANGISDKWLGTEDMVLAFAHQACFLDLPASAGLIPYVHHLCWEARTMHASATTSDFAAYANQAAVRAEIIAANESYNSVGPDPDEFANWYANAWFSYVLMAVGEPTLATPHFRNMGDYIGGPWGDVPGAARLIQSIRHRLGIEAL